MTGEQKLEEKTEEGAVEAKAEMVKEEKKVETEVKTEYKRSDYEYKSRSRGVPVPEGWERCPGYADVIRRLKPELLQPKEPPVEAAGTTKENVPKEQKGRECSCCH